MAKKQASSTARPRNLRVIVDQTVRAEVERIKTMPPAETKPDKGKADKGKPEKAKAAPERPAEWRIDVPPIGSTVSVFSRIREGDKTRLQRYTGMVIRHKGSGISKSITVRRIVAGEGVERIFPLFSPKIDRIEVTKHGRTRRAKLYFLRDRVGKGTRLREVIQGEREEDAAVEA